MLPTPPTGGGPFELSIDHALESVLASGGLKVTSVSEVNCPFLYPNMQTMWRAAASGGPLQAQIKVAGESALQEAIEAAAEPFKQTDGIVLISPNYFRYVIAEVIGRGVF
ncbi:MAG TPA: hypothetical protein VKY35_07925, partial [Aliidiomarina sp.]|nr:hypothetical protein [Aliidiomarina sp.]